MSQSYRRTNTTVSLINYHFIWIPRRRRKVLVDDVKKRVTELIYEKATELGCNVVSLAVEPEHIHLFLNCPPDLAPKQIMHRIKGSSSYLLRKEFPHLKKMPSMWTTSYFVSTAGNVSSSTIEKYIAAQGKN
ncbi:IS200/IS605 family transposase [Chroococcidiopsis thermalis]|uniref:Transposase IS200-family protein n=1 Tax=Chroococcidiopsis thermalis (strain PCC 7203) TaxID=251229 RepID=K9U855_CHRTP|nr:IS200/IS605 family transposase [Chroococcidiopsis thermalis]AFY91030.1 transposase IS200-family protein [Chroococcidiopsis thermalis PCC 7203]